MAQVVRALGRGGQRLAEAVLGFDRGTVRKGEHELRTGVVCCDGRAGNKRTGVLDRLPNLEKDIRDVVDCWSQTDPRFKTTRRYSKLSVDEVVGKLLQDKGYRRGCGRICLIHDRARASIRLSCRGFTRPTTRA